MSRFVVLIIARANPNEQLIAREHFGPLTEICALTTSSQVDIGVSSLQIYCPIPIELLHAIESGTRTDDLERTLGIKYERQRIRRGSFWFYLTPDDIQFIRSITRDNLMRLSGLIKRQLASPPQINGKPVADAIAELQAKCKSLIDQATF